MPAVDDPFSIAASLPGQMATLKGQVKDLSVNNTQALTQALAAATAAAGSAATASAAATAAANSALSAIVTPAVNSATGTAVWGVGYAAFAAFNFTVPAGCSRAVVVASGGSATFSSASAGDDYRMRVVINGVAGGESRSIQTSWNFVSAFSAANLTGLTAGATINVALQGHLTTGPGGTAGTAIITGIALFLV